MLQYSNPKYKDRPLFTLVKECLANSSLNEDEKNFVADVVTSLDKRAISMGNQSFSPENILRRLETLKDIRPFTEEDDDREGTWGITRGLCDYNIRTIKYDENLDNSELLQTICHELVHYMGDPYGLKGLPYNEFKNINEIIVQRISYDIGEDLEFSVPLLIKDERVSVKGYGYGYGYINNASEVVYNMFKENEVICSQFCQKPLILDENQLQYLKSLEHALEDVQNVKPQYKPEEINSLTDTRIQSLAHEIPQLSPEQYLNATNLLRNNSPSKGPKEQIFRNQDALIASDMLFLANIQRIPPYLIEHQFDPQTRTTQAEDISLAMDVLRHPVICMNISEEDIKNATFYIDRHTSESYISSGNVYVHIPGKEFVGQFVINGDGSRNFVLNRTTPINDEYRKKAQPLMIIPEEERKIASPLDIVSNKSGIYHKIVAQEQGCDFSTYINTNFADTDTCMKIKDWKALEDYYAILMGSKSITQANNKQFEENVLRSFVETGYTGKLFDRESLKEMYSTFTFSDGRTLGSVALQSPNNELAFNVTIEDFLIKGLVPEQTDINARNKDGRTLVNGALKYLNETVALYGSEENYKNMLRAIKDLIDKGAILDENSIKYIKKSQDFQLKALAIKHGLPADEILDKEFLDSLIVFKTKSIGLACTYIENGEPVVFLKHEGENTLSLPNGISELPKIGIGRTIEVESLDSIKDKETVKNVLTTHTLQNVFNEFKEGSPNAIIETPEGCYMAIINNHILRSPEIKEIHEIPHYLSNLKGYVHIQTEQTNPNLFAKNKDFIKNTHTAFANLDNITRYLIEARQEPKLGLAHNNTEKPPDLTETLDL